MNDSLIDRWLRRQFAGRTPTVANRATRRAAGMRGKFLGPMRRPAILVSHARRKEGQL